MKKLLFITILLLIIASYCYAHRDMFRDKDTISFGNTPADVQKKIKVSAFITDPKKVEYKGGEWYGDGQPAIIVYDGKTNHGLAKEYRHVQFYITVDEKFLSNGLSYDKPDTKDAYDIQLHITPKDTSYAITGEVLHLEKQFLSFNGNNMQKFDPKMHVDYLNGN
jgi:hypothetical protein